MPLMVPVLAWSWSIHEYGHCVGRWLRYGDVPCEVTFTAPFIPSSDGHTSVLGRTEGIWGFPLEEPVMYALQFLFIWLSWRLVGTWLEKVIHGRKRPRDGDC